MSTVVFDISMSLDGFVRAAEPDARDAAGPRRRGAAHVGDRRRRRGRPRPAGPGHRGPGAVICGRVTYDDSIRWWGADGPAGSARLPTFVVTHAAPTDVPADGVYVFVEARLEDALAQARAVAGGRTVSIMGGPALGNQFLRAGLVDELSIHLVPVLFGSGQRLTEALPAHIELEPVEQLTTTQRDPPALPHPFDARTTPDHREEAVMRFMVLVPGSPESEARRAAQHGGAGGDGEVQRRARQGRRDAGRRRAAPDAPRARRSASTAASARLSTGRSPRPRSSSRGYWIWECASREEAIEWLKRAPFDGGVEIELRQVDVRRPSWRPRPPIARSMPSGGSSRPG